MSLLQRQFRNSLQLFIRKCSTEQQPVELQGWIRKAHRQGGISFVHLAPDATSDHVQIVVPKQVCRTFSIGGAAKVSGKWVKSVGPGQDKEVLADSFTLLHASQIQPIRGSFSDIRNKLNIRPKHPAVATILKLRSKINFHTHKYFADKGFCHVDTPLLSVNDCEGAGEAFTVQSSSDDDFFGSEPVYLPVSGQLHLEAVCSSIPNVYTMNAAFRAEKSLTRHHMAEFRMLEVECAFMDSLDDLCKLVEDYVKFVISIAKNECAEELQKLNKILPQANEYLSTEIIDRIDVSRSFPKISYEEAASIVKQSGSKVENGFSKKQELDLVKHFEGPIFVQRFPANQKPFYMRLNDKDQAECFDLLFPSIGELAGGSVREYDFDKLKARNLSTNLDWYLQLREAGYPRSSGFGLGIDRFMQCLFSIDSIKDTLPFPRWFKRCQC